MLEYLGGRKFIITATGLTLLCIFVKDDTQFVIGLLGLVGEYLASNVINKKVKGG